MKFEYSIPDGVTIRRTLKHHVREHDRFDVIVDGELVANVDFEAARSLWTGEKPLEDVIEKTAVDGGNEV